MSKIKFKNFPFVSAEEKRRALRECYEDGYQSGFNCPDEWEEGYRKYGGPGGPFVFGDSQHPEYSNQSRMENEAWREGWKAGNKEKHVRRADMAKGWDDRGGIGEGRLW